MSSPFNEAQYEALLNGLNISIINFLEAHQTPEFRIDSEYFDREYLQSLITVTQHQFGVLGDFCKIKGGKRLPIGESFSEEGIPYIRAEDVYCKFVDYKQSPKISFKLHEQLQAYQTEKDDVLITIVGNIGDIGIVKFSIDKCNLTENCARLCQFNQGLMPEYVFVFLLSQYGQYQILREKVGTVQPKLALERIRKFKIPILSEVTQRQIQKLINTAYQTHEDSKQSYSDAEKQLFSMLKIPECQGDYQLTFLGRYVDFFQAGRLDAEYFQPQYSSILDIIQNANYTHKQLMSFIEPIMNGYDYRDFSEKGTPYIRVADIKQGRIDTENAAKVSITQQDVIKNVHVQEGDILFTRKGTFGNAAVVRREQLNIIISSEIMLIRIQSDFKSSILSDYLALYLNSSIGYKQVEQKVHGVGYYSISQPDLGKIDVILLPIEQQWELANHISASLRFENITKQLLNIAKRGVELAIEQTEQISETWIKDQIQRLQVSV